MEITIKIDDVETKRQDELKTGDKRVCASLYAKFFNEECKGWTNDPEANFMFLRHTESYATDMLRNRGHLFLNEVYDLLGIPRTKAGQVVGWVYAEDNPMGDNYVDFGLYNNESFINGLEKSLLLDFNVDGMILDKVL